MCCQEDRLDIQDGAVVKEILISVDGNALNLALQNLEAIFIDPDPSRPDAVVVFGPRQGLDEMCLFPVGTPAFFCLENHDAEEDLLRAQLLRKKFHLVGLPALAAENVVFQLRLP
jgi:hypothetical protein